MRFDKEHGEVVKGILREWIEGHSEGGVMSVEVKELWSKLCNSIDRKVMWYEGMPKQDGCELDFKWFGDRVLSDWCGVCGEVDRLVMEIAGKVIDEEEIVKENKAEVLKRRIEERNKNNGNCCLQLLYDEIKHETNVFHCNCRYGRIVEGKGVVCEHPSLDDIDKSMDWKRRECRFFEGCRVDDTEEVFEEISWCGRCKFRAGGYNGGSWDKSDMVCKSPFGDMVPEFDRNGKCLVFEEKE